MTMYIAIIGDWYNTKLQVINIMNTLKKPRTLTHDMPVLVPL